MLLRISLIVAILAGLAVGGLNFVKVKEKIVDLQTRLQQQTERADKAEKERDDTKRELTKTKTELTQTLATLKVTEEEKQRALAEPTTQSKRADKMNEDLNKTRTERDEAQQELTAYKVTGMTPQQVANANKQIKDLSNNLTGSQEENRLLGQKIRKVENELAIYKEPGH